LSDDARRARELVLALAASTRFAGSDNEQRARALCESRLLGLGFEATHEDFTYSQFPARFAPFICGLIFASGVLLAGHIAARHDAPLAGIILTFATLIVAGMLGAMLLERTGTLSWMRSESSNLVAMRRGKSAPPTVWLVAHTDSKSQTIGMLARVGSVLITGIFLTLLVVSMTMQSLGVAESMGFPADWLGIQTAILSVLTAIAIAPLILCFTTNTSPGALDNATGVAAVILSLEHIGPESNVGVLLTSAEEIGLAGARAFVQTRAEKGIAINCDTIDNSGRFICMTNDVRRRDAVAMAEAASRIGVKVKVRGIIRGILTDSIPFSRAGWESCTLSRGNLGTLSRVHTSRDEPGRIDGAGVALAARILAATVEELS
jgi:hypothetical protein